MTQGELLEELEKLNPDVSFLHSWFGNRIVVNVPVEQIKLPSGFHNIRGIITNEQDKDEDRVELHVVDKATEEELEKHPEVSEISPEHQTLLDEVAKIEKQQNAVRKEELEELQYHFSLIDDNFLNEILKLFLAVKELLLQYDIPISDEKRIEMNEKIVEEAGTKGTVKPETTINMF